ncbi:homeotic protein proboscipedia-like [Hetaerina americana]|uniref:homeotic protein proboscipedia-like n=1 Tax=Hetaerina americana TaxID=62018 RepID=UPI003A7F1264
MYYGARDYTHHQQHQSATHQHSQMTMHAGQISQGHCNSPRMISTSSPGIPVAQSQQDNYSPQQHPTQIQPHSHCTVGGPGTVAAEPYAMQTSGRHGIPANTQHIASTGGVQQGRMGVGMAAESRTTVPQQHHPHSQQTHASSPRHAFQYQSSVHGNQSVHPGNQHQLHPQHHHHQAQQQPPHQYFGSGGYNSTNTGYHHPNQQDIQQYAGYNGGIPPGMQTHQQSNTTQHQNVASTHHSFRGPEGTHSYHHAYGNSGASGGSQVDHYQNSGASNYGSAGYGHQGMGGEYIGAIYPNGGGEGTQQSMPGTHMHDPAYYEGVHHHPYGGHMQEEYRGAHPSGGSQPPGVHPHGTTPQGTPSTQHPNSTTTGQSSTPAHHPSPTNHHPPQAPPQPPPTTGGNAKHLPGAMGPPGPVVVNGGPTVYYGETNIQGNFGTPTSPGGTFPSSNAGTVPTTEAAQQQQEAGGQHEVVAIPQENDMNFGFNFYEQNNPSENSNSSSDFNFLTNLANDFAPEYYQLS